MILSMEERRSRVIGCILGGAFGDAAGSHFEGMPAALRTIDSARLECSDDTFLTLATMESIVEAQNIDPAHVAKTYLRYYQKRKLPGIGASTLHALQGLEQGGHWAAVGRKGEYAAGNGAAIRTAPLAFLLDPTDYFDRKDVRDMAWITHHNDEAYAGALAITLAVHMAWTDQWSKGRSLASLVASELPDSRVRDALLNTTTKERALGDVLQDIGTSGSAFASVPAAIVAAERAESIGFVEVTNEILSAGGDVDSIAAMCGQIFGATFGLDGLPRDLLSVIPGIAEITAIAEDFARFVVARQK